MVRYDILLVFWPRGLTPQFSMSPAKTIMVLILAAADCCLLLLLDTDSGRASIPISSPLPLAFAMPTLEGATRTAFLCFFLSHIPITLVIDGQAFFPRRFYPQVLRDVVDWYAITFKVGMICDIRHTACLGGLLCAPSFINYSFTHTV